MSGKKLSADGELPSYMTEINVPIKRSEVRNNNPSQNYVDEVSSNKGEFIREFNKNPRYSAFQHIASYL